MTASLLFLLRFRIIFLFFIPILFDSCTADTNDIHRRGTDMIDKAIIPITNAIESKKEEGYRLTQHIADYYKSAAL